MRERGMEGGKKVAAAPPLTFSAPSLRGIVTVRTPCENDVVTCSRSRARGRRIVCEGGGGGGGVLRVSGIQRRVRKETWARVF